MGVNLHVDLETLQLIPGPGQRSAVAALRFKRGDAARLRVVFLESGVTPVTIGDPDELEIQIGIKPRNQFDHSYLAHCVDWSMPSEGDDSPTYECFLSFNTLQLNSALNVGSESSEELSEITLMGEITWREGMGEPTSTRTFLVVVENDVNRGTEGAPSDANPGNITLTGTIAASNLSGTNTGDQDLSGLAPIAHTHVVADIVSVASQRLIGRHTSGNGAAQEIQASGGIEFSGGAIRRSALTGDVTASAGSNATTIANDAVSNAKLANMATATIKGRATAGTGDPEDLTAAQARAVIGAYSQIDINTIIAVNNLVLPDANAMAYVAAVATAGATVTNGQRTAINTFISGEKTAGRWDKIKRLYFPVWGVTAANAICMKSLTSGTFSGGITHAAKGVYAAGFAGNMNANTNLGALGVTNTSYHFALLMPDGSEENYSIPFSVNNTANLNSIYPIWSDGFSSLRIMEKIFSGGFLTNLPSIMTTGNDSFAGNLYFKERLSGSTGEEIIAGSVTLPFPSANLFIIGLDNVSYGSMNHPIGAFSASTELSSAQDTAYTTALKTLWETVTGLTLP